MLGLSLRAITALLALVACTSCGPTQTLVVRFDDLRSDFIVLEASLEQDAASGIDWQEQETAVPTLGPGIVRKISPKTAVVVLSRFAETERGRVTFETV